MRHVTGLAAVAVVGLVGVAVVGTRSSTPTAPVEVSSNDGTDRDRSRPATVMAAGAGLQGFDACDALTDHLRRSFAADPWGDDLAMMGARDGTATEVEADAGEATTMDDAAVPQPAGVDGTSDTNVQVAGVDELDLVETDGARVHTVNGGRLHVVDVAGPVPTPIADVAVDVQDGADGELLLHEDRLLVVARGWIEEGFGGPAGDVMSDMVMGSPVTTLTLFDVAGDVPVEVGHLQVEGDLVAGRGVDGTAHLVVAHRPQPLPMGAMDEVWAAESEDGMIRRLQDQLATTTATDWLPGLRHRGSGGVVTTTASVACADVARPADTNDTAMLQVLTVDTHGDDVMPEATTAVLTDARSVTATATELVVATPVWAPLDQPQPLAEDADAPRELIAPAPDQVTTRLHLFDLGPEGATHRASGEVPGMLLNQFSMSLHGGDLRVATTAGDAWAGNSESGVTVLRPSGDRLEAIGSVGGLGRGETIHAVRFLGDRAYVVTFRQTDPLYTIDLADPTAPEVTGELKITGYSAYLHPLGDGRLLGVGQEATLAGQTTGTQVSVFDVHDPANPTRVSQVTLPGAGSEAEWDHHAVLVHDGLVVLPYERWGHPTPENPEGYESAAIVIDQSDDALRVRGTVASTEGRSGEEVWDQAVRRVLVVDGRLVTISRSGVAVHDTATLDTTGELDLSVTR